MTEMAMQASRTATQMQARSEQCPDCGKGIELPSSMVATEIAVILNSLTVLCDRCAERRAKRIEALHAADQLRARFRDYVRMGWVGEDLQTYSWRASNPNIEAANVVAWREARAWYRTGEKNLYVFGAVGVGKTFAARACLREALVAGCSVAEVSAHRLCKVTDSFREGDGLVTAWKSVQVLFIDDLDKARWTPERLVALWELLDARTNSRKRTIVTTNIDSAPLRETLKAACPGNESHAIATMDRLRPILKLQFIGASQRGHA